MAPRRIDLRAISTQSRSGPILQYLDYIIEDALEPLYFGTFPIFLEILSKDIDAIKLIF